MISAKSTVKRCTSLFMAVMMIVTMMCSFATNAEAASASITKSFSQSNAYVTVKIDNSLINKSGKQYATVKLSTYNGRETQPDVVITLKDTMGRVIWSGTKTASCTLKLGDDHRVYRIYVRAYKKSETGSIFSKCFAEGYNWRNTGKCDTWKISNAKNCSIS